MARQPRLDLPHIPQHVVQRGNDRQPCFFAEIDHQRYLQDLHELSLELGCRLHAYVLMTNHVHLLMTCSQAGAIAKLMQSLGRRYVRYINDRYHRTGTLWEGRYKSCLVDSDDYLLRCYRYIELNPVRAGMVADPADYRWSSHRTNAMGEHDPLVHPHHRYLMLGTTEGDRRKAYRELVVAGTEASEIEKIRLTLQRQHALGNDRFRTAVERQLGRRAGPAKIGRPAKIG
ncbi:MAG TPA: transposase [Acetobacteraceae bacterium]